ncbi:GIY-YIG nuclease family protein [Candidatus Uhrbacteria bacterium]|nr:GIY-YIG nuclease family protein [Candidatus Uhrbacteria bacterium]MBT7717032.1 GIY-YIG nuclease family protein [Candidatus Uhrbacteria bacterium]
MHDDYHFVYIMTNTRHTVLYTGFTSDLAKRNYEHKEKLVAGFTKRYNATELVYFECIEDRDSALAREKQIKGVSRNKKEFLINSKNPDWRDLSDDIL